MIWYGKYWPVAYRLFLFYTPIPILICFLINDEFIDQSVYRSSKKKLKFLSKPFENTQPFVFLSKPAIMLLAIPFYLW